ncbi:RHS repeat domain-containing protein [Leifsonia sp. RAF41]|uniref:RHS repeat domain-containing protein n=1 Tax=Leifsonia sp. RAF41 TaxID=3233056 RepID=UPI003F9D1C44
MGGDIVVSPTLRSGGIVLAAITSPTSASGTGSFTASSLKPSSLWDVSAQTGTFSWQYPLRVPPAAAGPAPELSLSYDSQSVDGLTASTNNQPSALGEGWSLNGSGFIERSYVGCAVDDGASGSVKTSGDLCFKNANATVSFGGHSGELIQVAGSNEYRLADDDGTRFTEFKGAPCAANGTADTACWQMVTPEGTQYFFGLNRLPGYVDGKSATNSAWTVPVFGNDAGEPCHASTFAASSCALGWRWNLDYVVDVHGNAEAFYYNAQTNLYAVNGATATSYVRGGELDHIDYGLTSETVYAVNAASGRVQFTYDKNGRCSDASGGQCTAQPISGMAAKPAVPAAYPDIPFDQLCTSAPCSDKISPTFWTTSRLATVKAQVLSSGAYKDVDSWSLAHSYPAPGDGTSAALWLQTVTHTGYVGGASLAEPAVTFAGTTMQNRVWAVDGLAPLDKWRISSIKTELGATVSVSYSSQQCVPADRAAVFANPAANGKRCYPQWWSPSVSPPQAPQQDLFHKYVVTAVIDNPNTGGAGAAQIEKYYSYGTPAWRYNDSPLTPADKRTWSGFAGYDTAQVRIGDKDRPAEQNVTSYTFFQGLDGDRAAPDGGARSVSVGGIADSRFFAGQVRQKTVTAGAGGAVVSETLRVPWASPPTASDGLHSARRTGDGTTVLSEPVSTGGTRTITTTTSYDADGLPTSVQTVPSDAPASCNTTTYAPSNTSVWLIGLVAQSTATSGTCAQATSAGADRLISDLRTSYDGQAFGASPTRGDATRVEQATGLDAAGDKTWTTKSASTFDALGRVVETLDALGRSTKASYTPVSSGPPTAVTVTNPLGWTAKTTVDPATGATVAETDANGKLTTASYDALGRLVGVWLPNNPQSANPSAPTTKYTYTVSQTAASVVATESQVPGGTTTRYDLYDGLGRVVQSQSAAVQAGSVITDTSYDRQSRIVSSTKPYWAVAVASGKLFVPTSLSQVPSRTDTVFDAAGRTTASVRYTYGDEASRTTNTYPGADRVDVTPPSGGTLSSTITNSRGQKTALTQYPGPIAAGGGLTTQYEFSPTGRMSAMVDPAGNRWSWAYDVQGNQVSAVDPDSGTSASTFDAAGNQLTSTDARGQTLAYAYDALNRKTAQYSGDVAGPLLASWTFDTVAKGQLSSSSSYTGSVAGKPGLAYTKSVTAYDDLYHPTSWKVSIPAGAPAFGGTSYTVTSTYTTNGVGLSQQVLPAIGGLPAERLRTLYDGIGNIDSVQGTTMYGIATYTPISQLSQIERGSTNTLYTGFGYDPGTGLANQVIDTTLTGSVWTTQASRLYSRNAAGDVTSVVTKGAVGTDTQCFRYDGFRALTEAWTPASADCAASPAVTGLGGPAPYWASYTIDPATGNRTSSTAHTANGDASTAYSYPASGAARPHAVTAVEADAYSYDAAGNTTARPGQTLAYNEVGKPSTVTTGGVAQSNVYDADGTLLLRSDPTSGTMLFVGQTEVTVAPGASVASAVRTYSLGDVPVAERATKAGVSGSVVTWISGDLNHTQDLAFNNTTGAVTRRYTDPYGNTRGPKVPWVDGHGYLNKPKSAVTGLTQLGARLYDAVVGRFLSVDSILAPDNPAQNNGYAYSANNPITNSDPDGKCYVAGKDALNFSSNCGGGKGVAAPQISGHSAYEPQESSYDDRAIKKKGSKPTVQGHITDAGKPLVAILGPTPEEFYSRWAKQQRSNQQLEHDRKVQQQDAELKPGSGSCASASGKLGVGLGGSYCQVRTLDGKDHAIVVGNGAVGFGLGAGAEMSTLTTNARSADDLAGGSFGFQGGAELGVGATADQSWTFTNPQISTSQLGYGVGGKAYIGAEVGWTWVLY